MTSAAEASAPAPDSFVAALDELVTPMGWRLHSFNREDEWVGVVSLEQDPSFEQAIWVYDTERTFFRCLLVGRGEIPANRQADVIELCARINDGLAFGCAEYSFSDRAVVFRDAVPADCGSPKDVLASLSGRLFGLGSQYWPCVAAVLAGESADAAMAHGGGSGGAA